MFMNVDIVTETMSPARVRMVFSVFHHCKSDIFGFQTVGLVLLETFILQYMKIKKLLVAALFPKLQSKKKKKVFGHISDR